MVSCLILQASANIVGNKRPDAQAFWHPRMNDLHPQTYEDFLTLAGEGTVVPVVKRVMADLLTPVAAYLKIERLSPYSFLLESVEGGEKVARYSFLGFDPEIVVRSRASIVTIERGSTREETSEPMLAVLRHLSGQHIPVRVADLPPFVSADRKSGV